MPTHSQPRWIAASTAPRITAFNPGASPPPVEIAILNAPAAPSSRSGAALPRARRGARGISWRTRGARRPRLRTPARGLDQLDVRVRVGLANFGRQTGGPRLVVSDDTIFDGDAHRLGASGLGCVKDSRA